MVSYGKIIQKTICGLVQRKPAIYEINKCIISFSTLLHPLTHRHVYILVLICDGIDHGGDDEGEGDGDVEGD